MQAWLRANQLWQLVSGQKKRPVVDENFKSRESQQDKQDAWDDKAEKAAGWIYLMVDPSQTVHLKGKEDDPVAMWEQLKSVHLQQRPGARFNAYDDLFSIRKLEEESLQSLANRVNAAMQQILNIHPKDFTLDKLDEELLCMAMIRSLPEDYSHFVSTLMLSDKLDKAIISQAFHTEETQRVRRAAPQLSEVANKAATNYQPRKQHNYPSNKPSSPCHFCGKPGHWMKSCKLFLKKHGEGQAITQANAACDMVTGMTLSNKSKPDPICEPCLAGKMHANPFPTSYSRASQPVKT